MRKIDVFRFSELLNDTFSQNGVYSVVGKINRLKMRQEVDYLYNGRTHTPLAYPQLLQIQYSFLSFQLNYSQLPWSKVVHLQ